MTQEDDIIIPRWFLERIEDTLRIQYNINLDKKSGETCQDRNIKESLNGVRKLLRGEELTGGERLEMLQPSLPSNLDEAAEEAYPKMSRLSEPHGVIPADNKTHYLGDANEENREAFKAGAMWDRAKMMEKAEECFVEWYDGLYLNLTTEQMSNAIERAGATVGDKVKVIVIQEED